MVIPTITNPLVLLTVGIALVGSYVVGRIDGNTITEGAVAREDRIAQVVYEKGQRATAELISGIEVKNVTVRQVLQKEIVRDPVYVDCKHSAVGLRAVNAALTGGTVSPGDSELSGAGTND